MVLVCLCNEGYGTYELCSIVESDTDDESARKLRGADDDHLDTDLCFTLARTEGSLIRIRVKIAPMKKLSSFVQNPPWKCLQMNL